MKLFHYVTYHILKYWNDACFEYNRIWKINKIKEEEIKEYKYYIWDIIEEEEIKEYLILHLKKY